jgi:hypothetical protein
MPVFTFPLVFPALRGFCESRFVGCFLFQPIDPGEVAKRVYNRIQAGSSGELGEVDTQGVQYSRVEPTLAP